MNPSATISEARVLSGPRTATAEPMCCSSWSPGTYSLCATREATKMRNVHDDGEQPPPAATRKSHTKQWRLNTAKHKRNKHLTNENKRFSAWFSCSSRFENQCLRSKTLKPLWARDALKNVQKCLTPTVQIFKVTKGTSLLTHYLCSLNKEK